MTENLSVTIHNKTINITKSATKINTNHKINFRKQINFNLLLKCFKNQIELSLFKNTNAKQD